MTRADREGTRQIRHEIEFGTPNTPQRIAAMKRADEVYYESFARPEFLAKVHDWINSVSHDEAANAWSEMQNEFGLTDDFGIGHLPMGVVLCFLQTLAEQTL